MNIRERQENLEKTILSDKATYAMNSKGRKNSEMRCDIRTCFQRDRDRIIHSKAFRRLKHKTQVFISPEGDHYRTRLTHTLEVAQIARSIARALSLNEDLVEAIALAHDLGHTPFGHTGEVILDSLNPKGFKHNEQSLRVVDLLEYKDTRIGLNLTYEVRDGIVHHTGKDRAKTLEGRLIRYADRIAYINHDIDDAIRANLLTLEQIPKELREILGNTHSERINTMIRSLISASMDLEDITMDKEVGEATEELRAFMFKNVYFNPTAKSEDDKIKNMLTEIYNYYEKHFERIPLEHMEIYKDIDYTKDDVITDFIAGMSDRYAVNLWKDLFMPKSWSMV